MSLRQISSGKEWGGDWGVYRFKYQTDPIAVNDEVLFRSLPVYCCNCWSLILNHLLTFFGDLIHIILSGTVLHILIAIILLFHPLMILLLWQHYLVFFRLFQAGLSSCIQDLECSIQDLESTRRCKTLSFRPK